MRSSNTILAIMYRVLKTQFLLGAFRLWSPREIEIVGLTNFCRNSSIPRNIVPLKAAGKVPGENRRAPESPPANQNGTRIAIQFGTVFEKSIQFPVHLLLQHIGLKYGKGIIKQCRRQGNFAHGRSSCNERGESILFTH